MSDEEQGDVINDENKDKIEEEKPKSTSGKIIDFVVIICAVLVGRLVGLVGVGAIIIGWLSYTKFQKKMGVGIGVVIGVIIGITSYFIMGLGLYYLIN